MPIPPRKPLRPHVLPSAPKPPGGNSGIAPAAPAPAAYDAASPKPAPARRPFAKRRVVARSGDRSDRLLNVFMIRLGIGVFVLLLGGFGGRSLFSSSSPNQRYFDQLAELSRLDGEHKSEELVRRLKALPISGVTDPKLQEIHQVLMDLFAMPDGELSDEAKARGLALLTRMHQLRQELNAKYGGK